MNRIILASASVVRRQLLEQAGITAESCAPAVDEQKLKAEYYAANPAMSPQMLAMRLAHAKALSVSQQFPGALVIGGDQVLSLDGRRFDKPAGMDEGRSQLRELRGKLHYLETALACAENGKIVWETISRPRLRMRDFSDAYLENYLLQMGPFVTQTVGGYKLEGLGIQLFETVEGDYFSILGLPLLPLLDYLRNRGFADV